MSPRDHSRLTSRQREILEFIGNYNAESGFAPSVRDIGNHFGLNPATVHDHLKALQRKGQIEKQPGLSRSLKVKESLPDAPRTDAFRVPLVGRVAAGEPLLAEQNVEDAFVLPLEWAPEGAFLLRVQGDSMRDAHILDGDLVLVRPQPTAMNGDIVVARIEDEATVKRFYRTPGGIELRAENPAYRSIRIDASQADTFAILGSVVGVLRF